jgi:hypothetical protein
MHEVDLLLAALAEELLNLIAPIDKGGGLRRGLRCLRSSLK